MFLDVTTGEMPLYDWENLGVCEGGKKREREGEGEGVGTQCTCHVYRSCI